MKKLLLLFFVNLSLISNNAFGQSYFDKDSVLHNPIFYISAGGYSVDMQTRLRVDSKLGIGTEIGLEDDLKMESNAFVFKADALVRLKQRSQLAFSYTSTTRRREFEVIKSFTLGEENIDIGAYANLYFNTYYYALTWRYSFFNKPNWNAGLSFGLRAINIKTGIEGNLNQREFGDDYAVTVPSILIGLHGSAYLTPRLLGRYTFEYFKATIADIDIRVLETSVSLEYYIIKNVGLGVGFNTNTYVARDIPFNNNREGKVVYGFEGFYVKVVSRF